MGRNFIIYTRGRTGSTAVRSELNSHPDIICYGEMFRRNAPQERADVPPNEAIPYRTFKGTLDSSSAERECYRKYLRHLLTDTRSVVGFKLLANQARENPRLLKVLEKRGFVALHLVRRNFVRQIVSGMVARERGAYNRIAWVAPGEKYTLDLSIFRKKARNQAGIMEQEQRKLTQSGLEHTVVYYEDFVADRSSFFSRIFEFLGVSGAELAPSEFSIMTDRNLRNVVANYDGLAEVVRSLGLENMLESS